MKKWKLIAVCFICFCVLQVLTLIYLDGHQLHEDQISRITPKWTHLIPPTSQLNKQKERELVLSFASKANQQGTPSNGSEGADKAPVASRATPRRTEKEAVLPSPGQFKSNDLELSQ